MSRKRSSDLRSLSASDMALLEANGYTVEQVLNLSWTYLRQLVQFYTWDIANQKYPNGEVEEA